jgi:hypothetical protein
MAGVGAAKVDREKLAGTRGAAGLSPRLPPLAGGLNLVIPTADLVWVAQRGVDLPIVGLPIMREGFVTGTGFLSAPEKLTVA